MDITDKRYLYATITLPLLENFCFWGFYIGAISDRENSSKGNQDVVPVQ